MIGKKYVQLSIRLTFVLAVMLQLSCQKYLDKKPQQNMALLSTLNDLQVLLDNQVVNDYSTDFAEMVADNYYLTTSSWNNMTEDLRSNYIWASDARITTNFIGVWGNPYRAVYHANLVLDLLPGISFNESERSTYNNIKGSALFYRSFMFHQLAQLYCRPYSASAGTDPGIVIRLIPDTEAPASRGTVQQTYDQIISDLTTAAELLPAITQYNTRPAKAAVQALLARVYLSMREYTKANQHAEMAIQLQGTLLDYNSLAPANNPVFPANPITNQEIIYFSATAGFVFSANGGGLVDPALYQSYSDDDLRKKIFYGTQGNEAYWKGSYKTSTERSIFTGIGADEIYLIRAECRARAGNTSEAMDDLNYLLRRRWRTGTFTDLTAANAADALAIILIERRKELAFRGIRWSDLRRFNLEAADITLTRSVNNSTYTLPPNDPRWVLLIPEVEITRSGIAQNPR